MVRMDDARPMGKVLPMTPAPDGVELRHLRAFVAVAEELNFSRAATRLYVSQPALSRQIRALERLIGCDLLRRSTHRVELTIAGEALLGRSHELLHEVDDAIAATRSVGGELDSRLARIWEPIVDLTTAGPDLQTLRNVCEDLHAQFPVPEVAVRHVNAGGVPSLMSGPAEDQDVTVLFLHGGGYVMGSAFGYRHLAGALAIAADATALVPEYRLAPEHPFPAALDDALRAYQWVLGNGTTPEQLTVVGDSAGAGLVLSLVLTLKQQGLPLPGGTVMLCPGLRLTFDDDRETPTAVRPGVSVEQLRALRRVLPGRASGRRPHPRPSRRRPDRAAPDAHPGRHGRRHRRGCPPPRRARPPPRRRRTARAVPGRHPRLPDLLVVPARGRRGRAAGRSTSPAPSTRPQASRAPPAGPVDATDTIAP